MYATQNTVELQRLVTQVLEWVSNAEDEDTDETWERVYHLVFSRNVSTAIKNMGVELNYYDPDSSYREDVQAYAEALQQKILELSPAPRVLERFR